MAESRFNPVVVAGALIGGAAGLFLLTPRGRRWAEQALESARNWVEYTAEDLGQVLEARVERSTALRQPHEASSGGMARQVDERVVTTRVRQALARDPRVHARKITILTIGGVVHLEGAVGSLEEKEVAGEIAQEAARTQILVNDLHVIAS